MAADGERRSVFDVGIVTVHHALRGILFGLVTTRWFEMGQSMRGGKRHSTLALHSRLPFA